VIIERTKKELAEIQQAVNTAAATLWEINQDELKAVGVALAEL
jgi:hypothetical protein